MTVLKYSRLIFLCAALSGSLQAEEGVILLHGLLRSASSMEEMAAMLRDNGYTVLNCDYPSSTDSIAPLADQVIGAALHNDTLTSCTKINFVTHSLGGILVRSYLSRHSEPRLGRVVMLGPPNQGSEVVDKLGDWWIFDKVNGPGGTELGTDSLSTPNRLGPVDFELGIIAGDRSINWINSLMIDGPDDGKVSVEKTKVAGMKGHVVVHTIHPMMMKNKKVQRLTLAFLRNGAFGN